MPRLSLPAAVSERERVLRRIAETLELSLVDLYEAGAAACGSEPSKAECAALISAFHRISDPDLRRRCLALVQAFSEV
ncbi:hypothetical protein J2X36_002373 [Methylobacterium sp. BE186]|uniref:hypothetical protein n=1 Tax=Methylobacterium sp. BE186 TaxID=2817715 RepID=UPI00285B1769|nr:hypothetical protein [Methylobacterium sp. BE186]MDR7037626.1 hypothetical protein [Methylobacterium sp. BE186]